MWSKIKDCAGSIAAVLSMIAIVFGGYFYIDKQIENRALASDLQKTNQRLEQKIVSDRLNQIQERLWRLEDRHQERKPTDLEKEEIRKLKLEKEQIERDMKK